MKRLFLFMISIVCTIVLHANVGKKDVCNIINQVVNDTISEIWISKSHYIQNDTINLWIGFVTCPFDSAWGVFVDYHPLHNWGHECAYIFVDKFNGEYRCIKKTLPPIDISEQWTKYRAYSAPKTSNASSTSYFQELISQFNITLDIQDQRTQNRTFQSNPHLYAIIVDYCGSSPDYNYARFKNDCMAMYATFINNGYMANHIYVAMPDDTISMNKYETKSEGIINLFEDISRVLTSDDILSIYLTGHGDLISSLDYPNSYLGFLSDGDFLLDSTLISYIGLLNAGIVNLIVQRQCPYHLKGNPFLLLEDRNYYAVISCDDVAYSVNQDSLAYYQVDKYTERWIYAVNRENLAVCDSTADGYISMYEAHSYAIAGCSNPYYCPHQDSNPTCLVHDLTLTEVLENEPCIQSDIYIRDNEADRGREPNTSTNLSYISPDIWIEDLSGDTIQILTSNEQYNVCVRIQNRGSVSSSGDEVLHLHWTKAVIGGSWPNNWKDGSSYDCNGIDVAPGGEITPLEGCSLSVIPPGEEYVVRIPWTTPNNNNYLVCSEFENNIDELWHYCLLARIYEGDENPGADMNYQPLNTFVLNSNNVAARNITIMSAINSSTLGSIIGVVAPYTGYFSLKSTVYSNVHDFITGNLIIKLYLDSDLSAYWDMSGYGFEDVGNSYQINMPIAELENMYMDEDMLYVIKVEVENTNLADFIFDITLHDSYGNLLGGESFRYGANMNPIYYAPSLKNETEQNARILDDIGTISNAKRIIIINTLGQLIGELDGLGQESQTNIDNLPHGAYAIIIDYENETKTYKFVR